MCPPSTASSCCPLPSTGSFRSPASSVPMRQSDIPTSSPSLQASPRLRPPFLRRCGSSLPQWAVARTGSLDLVHPAVRPGPSRTEMLGPPGFLPSPLCARAVVLDPGGSRVPHHNGTHDAAFSYWQSLGSHHLNNFGAAYLRPVRSLSTLRSHGCPCATQDSLAARRLRFDRMGLPPIRLACPVSEACTSFPGRRLSPAHADYV